MREKLNVRQLLLVLLAAFSIYSCAREDLLQQETPKEAVSASSAKYASRSLWKEDDVYIGKVQQVFLKHANLERFNTTYGELYWNYAMSFGQFGEKYLLVPIVKKDKVVLLMEAVRKGDRLYFYEKSDADLLAFFQHVLYSNIISHSEVIDGNEVAAKAKYVCSTRTIVIGCLNGQTDCEPVSYSHMVCEWQEDSGGGVPPKSFPPLGDPFGGGGGGGGDDGYEYPDPPEENPCEKMKARTTDSTFKNNITTLEGKTGESSERGYRMDYQNQTPTNPTGTGISNQYLQNKPGSSVIDYRYFLPSTFAIIHTHYDSLNDPIFSPGDIIQFNDWLVNAKAWNDNPANTIKIDLTKLTYTLVTSQGNYTFTFDGTDVAPFQNYTQQQFDDLNDKYIREVLTPNTTIANMSGNVIFNMNNMEEEFLRFAKANLNISGMKLFKVEDNGNTEIFLKPNNNRDTKPCN